MKTIKIEKDSTDEQEHLILSKLDHHNIVKFYEHFEDVRFGFNYLFVYSCIVSEYCRVIRTIHSFKSNP